MFVIQAGVSPQKIEARLRERLPQVVDVRAVATRPDGQHFEVTVVSDAFEGLGRVERHRMVYEALGDLMDEVHALALRTYTSRTRPDRVENGNPS